VASHSLLGLGTSDDFSSLTWNLDILILIFVAIAGVMSYSLALEKGQLTQQFLSLRVSRARLVVLKWMSLFVVFVAFAMLLDFTSFFVYLGYFPNLSAYSNWGGAPTYDFLIAVGEQLAFLAFLNSLVMAVSFGLKKTTLSLLVFLAFALFSAGFLTFGVATIPAYLQLGYGDYLIANGFSHFVFSLLYRSGPEIAASTPALVDYLGLAYRGAGAIVLFLVGLGLFVRADLD
jgi:hypothetical protein